MATVTASEVQDLYDSVKTGLMSGIVNTNIDAASPTNVADGFGNVFQKTYYGPSNFACWEYISGDDRGDWAWTHSMHKTSDSSTNNTNPVPHTDYAILNQVQYQEIWGLQKRFYLPAPAIVHIHISADINSPKLNEWGIPYRQINYSGNTASNTFMFVDGVIKNVTKGYEFEESIGPAPANEIGHGITSSFNDPPDIWTRRYYSTFQTAYMSAGWHTVQVKTDCRVERTYAARRSISIDGWYV